MYKLGIIWAARETKVLVIYAKHKFILLTYYPESAKVNSWGHLESRHFILLLCHISPGVSTLVQVVAWLLPTGLHLSQQKGDGGKKCMATSFKGCVLEIITLLLPEVREVSHLAVWGGWERHYHFRCGHRLQQKPGAESSEDKKNGYGGQLKAFSTTPHLNIVDIKWYKCVS